MKIDKAIKIAIRTGKPIRRKSMCHNCALIPTNTLDDVIVMTVDNRKPPAKWWHPSADDLMANDWELAKLKA